MDVRRRKRVEILTDFLEEGLRTTATVAFHVMDGLPDDAVLVDAGFYIDAMGRELVFLEFVSTTYPEAPEGEPCPTTSPTMMRLPYHPLLAALAESRNALRGEGITPEDALFCIDRVAQLLPETLRWLVTGERERVH